MTDRLVIKLKEKENALHCVYLNDYNMVIAAFILQSNEAKNWYDGITKARHIYVKLKQGTFVDAQGHSVKIPQQLQQQHGLLNSFSVNTDNISIRKSPVGSSIGKFNVACANVVCYELKKRKLDRINEVNGVKLELISLLNLKGILCYKFCFTRELFSFSFQENIICFLIDLIFFLKRTRL